MLILCNNDEYHWCHDNAIFSRVSFLCISLLSSRLASTYFFNIVKGIEYVIRQARKQINDKPASQIVHSDDLRVRDHFAPGPDEGRMKIEHNIDEENNVDNAVEEGNSD